MNSNNDCLGQNEKLKPYPFLYSKRKPIYQTALGLLGPMFLMTVIFLGTAFAGKIPEETQQKIKGVRVPFIMNQGQMDRQVRFYAKTFSGTVYVTDQGRMVYQLPTSKDQKDHGWVLVEEALDGLPMKEIQGEKEAETQVSFFIGNDPAKWQKGLATYETVNLGEIYKGIGLKLRAYGGRVEKLYYIGPGREPKEIRIKVHGAEALKVNDQGELEARTGNGPVVFSRPKAFQQAGNHQEAVEVAYVVDRDSYGFKVGGYDKSRELIIDPLVQSTYLGGSSDDYATSIAVSGGNVYVAGYTGSTNFPGISEGYQPGFGGGSYDAFVSLLTADLKTLTQSTYLGGSYNDYAYAMVVSEGNVYVAGQTYSTDFPKTGEGAYHAIGGGSDAFVSLLTADLKTLTRSTYLGGSSDDYATSIAVSGGNVYVAGQTLSSNFPHTSGGAQAVAGGGGDTFVSLLTADLKTLTQSTYLGGSSNDEAYSMVVSGGNVYVAGQTLSSNFPNTNGGAQSGFGGGNYDAFVSLLTADLKTLTQSTYLGGSSSDYAQSMVVSGGNVYVAGQTYSNIFPGTSGGARPGYGGDGDAFVSLLTADLKTLTQSTYLGGSSSDYAQSMVVSGGNVYVAGQTSSSNFPHTNGGAQSGFGGGNYDAFVSLLTADLKTLTQSTYLGGSSSDYANSMAVSGGNVYVAGPTSSTNFPHTNGGAQPGTGGNGDAFVALLSADLKTISAPNVITGSATKVTVNSATLNGTVYPNGFLTTYYFEYGPTTSYGNVTSSQSAGSGSSDVAVTANITGLTPNTTYHYRLVAVNSAGTTYGADMTLKTSVAPLPWLMLLLGD